MEFDIVIHVFDKGVSKGCHTRPWGRWVLASSVTPAAQPD
jgi:hypothetical protein